MIAIVAPEPVDWLAPLVAALDRPISIFAPWALPAAPIALPQPLAAFWRRRQLATIDHARPWWVLGEAALRVWTGTNVDRLMRTRVWRRAAADALAARWLPTAATLVIAPSLAARRTLALAQSRGQRTALLEDLPSFRELHADLDAAATRWPDSTFLRRFRAPAAWVAEQESERVLADALIVRSTYAQRHRSHAIVATLTGARVLAPALPRVRARTILLAGSAAARLGTNELLAAIADRPDTTLLVQIGEAMEPRDLLTRPNVRAATPAERDRLEGVDLVAAPALCETHCPQLARAAARGIPIVATDRAAGCLPIATIPVGDIAALRAALDDPPVLGTATFFSLWEALQPRPQKRHLAVL